MSNRQRRQFLLGAGAMLVFPSAGMAQQAGKVWRIGFLNGGPRPADGIPPAVLREALAALGYATGRNISFDARWAEAKIDRLPALAAEIVQARVDVIIVNGWLPAQAVKLATTTIPIIVSSGIGDAVESGLVASLAHPGGNMTGISDMEVDLSGKRLQLLKETFPKAARVAILWNQDDAGMTLRYKKIEAAARTLGITVQALGVREPDDFNFVFSAMTRTRPDAIFLVADILTNQNRIKVIEFARIHRIPAMYEGLPAVQAGGLMSYGSSSDEGLQRAAYYVDRIFKGTKPADLPMEQPTRFYLTINQKTAKALGLTIPPSILMRADQVIE